MSKLRLGGLSSGMDTEAIIQKLTKPYKMKVDNTKQRKTSVQWKKDAYIEMNKTMAQFILDSKKDLGLISTTGSGTVLNKRYANLDWLMKAESSNENIATALTSAASKPGVYDIDIKNIAKTASAVSSGKLTMDGGANGNLVDQFGLKNTDVIKFTLKTHKSEVSESFVGSQTALSSTTNPSQSIAQMFSFTPDSKDQISFTIKTDQSPQGKTFQFNPNTATLEQVIKAIDDAGIGVEAAYDAANDKFFMQRKDKGEGKWIEIEDTSVLNGKGAGLTFIAGGISGSLLKTGVNNNQKIVGESKGITFSYNQGGSSLNQVSLENIAEDINKKQLGLKAIYDKTLDRLFFETEKTGENSWFEIVDESYTQGATGTAASLTKENLLEMGFSGVIDYNVSDYGTKLTEAIKNNTDATGATVDYAAMDEATLRATLQGVIDRVNTDGEAAVLTKIDGFATASNAGTLTIDMLKASGATGVYAGNLDAYKTAISAETGISDITALQTVVDTVNTAQKDALLTQLRTGSKTPDSLTYEDLEKLGLPNLRAYNVPHYRTTIGGIDMSTMTNNTDLDTEIQSRGSATNTAVENSSLNILNLYTENGATNITKEFLISAGLTDVRENNLVQYQEAIQNGTAPLTQGDFQTLIQTVNDAKDTESLIGFRANAAMPAAALNRIHFFAGTTAHPDSLLKLNLQNGVKKTGLSATFDLNGAENLKSETNNIDIQGFTLNVKGTGKTTIKVATNVDEIVKKVSTFVEKYNETVDTLTKKLNEKKEKDFRPLTDDEKKAMSDDQVENWETKAKSGILKNDNLIQRALDKMRGGLYQRVQKYSDVDLEIKIKSYVERLKIEDPTLTQTEIDRSVSAYQKELQGYDQITQIGITTETFTKGSINNRLRVDESKLRLALQKDPNSVIELLFKEPPSDTDLRQGIFNQEYDRLKKLNPSKTDQELRAMANIYMQNNKSTVNRLMAEKSRNQSGIITRLHEDITVSLKEVVNEAGVGDEASLLRDIKMNILVDFVTKRQSRSKLDKDLLDFDEDIKNINKTMTQVENRYYKQFAEMEKQLQKLNAQGAWIQQNMMMQQQQK